MASNRVKTRELKSGEIVAYSESAIRNNASAVEYCRTSMAALSGSTAGEIILINQCSKNLFRLILYGIVVFNFAGIMGLTGILGFLFYLVAVLGLWCLLLLKSGSNWQKYFISRKSLLTNGFLGGLCTYVLFWTFLFGMVHVY